ncbi:MAG: hypothetical protein JOZ06_18435 [Paludibacterium sp.]|nr:hypothetical protein [Paludibacterium sp.]
MPGDVVSIGIGQGYNSYTPLQMANATAVLANGGWGTGAAAPIARTLFDFYLTGKAPAK